LFEGFVSFKPKGRVSSHCADVEALRAVVLNPNRAASAIVPAAQLAMAPSDRLVSAFAVAGMDFGVPLVARVMANQPLQTDINLQQVRRTRS
jgi:hypothetical protein